MSGQLPNRAGSSFPGQLPLQQQMNGNYQISGQMQNPVGPNRGMDAELLKARRFMSERICEFLMRRQQHPHEIPQRKMVEIIKKLEEGLFKAATTKDEYVNLATLESRLLNLIRRPNLGNQGQQYSNVNSSSIGTMIPTPGMPQAGNSSLMGSSSVDNAVIMNNNNTVSSSMVSSGNFMPISNSGGGGSLPTYDGSFSNGHQNLSSSFGTGAVGNNMGTGVERMPTQMIPTPGFSNTSNTNMENSSINNQSYRPNNAGAFSSAESSMLSLPLQQKPLASTHNGHILHNLATHMGGGIRPSLAQTSYGMINGNYNGGVEMLGNDLQIVNGGGSSEGYMQATLYGSSQKQLDQHQQPLLLDDGYGMSVADASGSENLFVPVTSVGSLENRQNLNCMNLQSISNTNPTLMLNQSNLHTSQPVNKLMKESVDQSEKLSYPSHSSSENLIQSHQQFQHNPGQFSQQYLQPQNQQNLQNQNHQILLKNNSFAQSQTLSHIKSEPGLERQHEALKHQATDQFQRSDVPNRFSKSFIENPSRSSQYPSIPSALPNSSSQNQTSQLMQQMLHQNQFVPDTLSDFGSLSGGVQSGSMMQNQWYSKPQDESSVPVNCQTELSMQKEFHQRMTGLDEAQENHLSADASINPQSVINRSEEPSHVNGAMSRSTVLNRERQYKNQQRWLLFLRHARRCPAPEGKCPAPHCIIAQKLLRHIEDCNLFECSYPRCHDSKVLIDHHRHCKNTNCPVCLPVKNFVAAHLQASRNDIRSSLQNSVSGSGMPYVAAEVSSRSTEKDNPGVDDNSERLEPSLKRLNIGKSSQPLLIDSGISREPVTTGRDLRTQQETLPTEQHCLTGLPLKSEVTEVKIEFPGVGERSPDSIVMSKGNMGGTYSQRHDTDATLLNNKASVFQQESINVEKEVDQVKLENNLVPHESASGSKSGKPTIKGVSLIELFTPEQVREHIRGLRQWVGQSKAKAEKNQAMEHSMSENSCQLCAVEKVTFEPPPIYCSPCGARIKRNAMYYTIGAGETRHYFCIHCHNESRGDTILVDGTPIAKARLEKKKNDEETEEWWVQCDKCEAWQHQICALFNGRRNDGGQAEYTCPNCYIAEVERGERTPLPQSAVLGAKDLPQTILSDHIEKRLAKKLKQERQERARLHGKSFDEVPGADGLVVRVVSSVDKKLEVKSRFLEIFKEENYPSEFPYKSKVVLLFQKIEGVEVCLFGMYLQEFGSECQEPNQRRVYLSYLDSVKYFRPDVRTVSGEALRTYVYHEILIAYLEYCKMRGFNSCYIWACPPLKGEDYILYCHPEIQKTPKSDKLREWYLAMLRKAARENIVVELTNLYDHFFVTTGECRAKVTAARLPYFDGDYWPGAAEDMIFQLQQEEEGRKQQKKSLLKKNISKRALKASGQMDLSGNVSKDLLLMHKLGETIYAMKEDFIMVHLQHACTHCCFIMVSGNRWVCNICKNFQLCDRCYEAEQKRDDGERHPVNRKDKHSLYRIEINDVPEDTKDRDEILESEFFDTRQAFLSLCQGNHYQYDTLRRAKHSSMMVLYHLHNPTAPAFVTTCNVCHLDIETGEGWRCETCPEYDVCNACYQKDGGVDHPHKLTNHPSMANHDAQSKEARQLRVTQLKKMLELLVHASQCRSSLCQYPNCRKVKGLFRHGMQCKVRASGGCELCKKMWYLLQLHARACKESACNVPRCRDLKDHLKRLQQQSDSRRRAAVMEMMRQRAAEVAGGSE